MIPLNYWGGYGAYPARNPGWYYKDEIDRRAPVAHLHLQERRRHLQPSFFGGWKFIVFEPDGPVAPGTLDLSKFINYLTTQKDSAGTPWATQRVPGQRGAGHRAGGGHRRHDGEQLPGLEVSQRPALESALRGAFLLALRPFPRQRCRLRQIGP